MPNFQFQINYKILNLKIQNIQSISIILMSTYLKNLFLSFRNSFDICNSEFDILITILSSSRVQKLLSLLLNVPSLRQTIVRSFQIQKLVASHTPKLR